MLLWAVESSCPRPGRNLVCHAGSHYKERQVDLQQGAPWWNRTLCKSLQFETTRQGNPVSFQTTIVSKTPPWAPESFVAACSLHPCNHGHKECSMLLWSLPKPFPPAAPQPLSSLPNISIHVTDYQLLWAFILLSFPLKTATTIPALLQITVTHNSVTQRTTQPWGRLLLLLLFNLHSPGGIFLLKKQHQNCSISLASDWIPKHQAATNEHGHTRAEGGLEGNGCCLNTAAPRGSSPVFLEWLISAGWTPPGARWCPAAPPGGPWHTAAAPSMLTPKPQPSTLLLCVKSEVWHRSGANTGTKLMLFFFLNPQCSHWMSMAQKSLVHCNVHNFSHTAV